MRSSAASRRWTNASLELVGTPRRAKAASAALLPAPIPPVTATVSGLRGVGVVGVGLDALRLDGRSLRLALRRRQRLRLLRGRSGLGRRGGRGLGRSGRRELG